MGRGADARFREEKQGVAWVRGTRPRGSWALEAPVRIVVTALDTGPESPLLEILRSGLLDFLALGCFVEWKCFDLASLVDDNQDRFQKLKFFVANKNDDVPG